jgi:PAS domain S-box-containing protein
MKEEQKKRPSHAKPDIQIDSKDFSDSLLRDSPEPLIVSDADGAIIFVNPATENLTGYSSAELIGTKPPYLWWPQE